MEDKIKVVARLRLKDGREFDYHTECEQEYIDSNVFWWTEGNASCDCNKKLFLDREYNLNINDGKCGDEIELISLTHDGILQDLHKD